MLTRHIPDTIRAPFSAYSHGVEAPPDARWLYVSGQVGVTPDGTLAEGPEAQHEQTWRNVLAVLESAGMGPQDLVRVNGFITHAEDVAVFRGVRDRMLGGAEPASTLLVVAGLAHPDWRIEIEAVAAKAP
ncbi:MAG: RidA family protein [Alphaproteobacteria bacterium]|nr:RidA family protein [Alphaproteobacteria bacterium]